MPYIKQERRNELDSYECDGKPPQTPGELNYFLSTALKYYWEGGRQDYQRINDIIGALEACKLEFYRRVVVPFENTKIEENGDVY